MRDGRRRPVPRSAALALCAAVAVGAWAPQARGGGPVVQHGAGATPLAPPFIEVHPGGALPDWLLEDGHGRRFRLSETRGRPLVLTLGFTSLKWDWGVRALQVVAGRRGRAAVLHLVAVPITYTEDAPGTPPVPARDPAEQHREDTAWLAGAGEDPGRSVRRVPRGPGDGPRPWRFPGGQMPLLVVSDADGVVRQLILRDTATRAQAGWGALLDAAIACAGGGPPLYEDGRALVASGRVEACAAPAPSGEPHPARRDGSPAPPPPDPSRQSPPD